MKHKNPLDLEVESSLKKLFSNKAASIDNILEPFLSLFIEKIDFQTIIFSNIKTIEALLRGNTELWIGAGVAFIIKKSSISNLSYSPDGFKNKYHIINKASETIISANNKIKVIICEKGAEKEKRLEKGKKKYKTDNVSHETLIDFLNNEEYKMVDMVREGGEYAARGAIIDVYDPTSTQPIRINLFEDRPTIKSLDISSQTTEKEVETKFIHSNKTNNNLTLTQKLKGLNYEKLEYKKQALKKVNSPVNNSVDFGWASVGYKEYIYNKNKYLNVYKKEGLLMPLATKGSVAVISKNVEKNNANNKITNFDLSRIEIGDYICHEEYGVGLYRGLKQHDIAGQEVLVLEYKNKNHVYLNIQNISKVHFYAKAESKTVLDNINRPGLWRRKKSFAEKQAEMFVDSVVDNLLTRSKSYREKRLIDHKYLEAFVSSFKYVDTKDQLSAWKQIKKDLMSNKVMDRLVCGDVGFGKTELAIRAAFCAVISGEQVVVLAPTTLLVNQLKSAFSDRLAPFGVFVDIISRLKSSAETQNICESFKNKKIDILIGTHKIINVDIPVNNVGLLVVDEEHRFGVNHKDLLKTKFKNSDFLMLSATPIPRSLYLGLSNIYQISVLATPPRLRKPIETHVVFYNQSLIEKAVDFELSRGGQTFIVYNSTKRISSFSKRFSFEFNAGVDYIHGQMPPKEVKLKMDLFANKKINVLFTTSIIESGIDVASANTIIIINSHNFGLSQLYQIRGRVGRSDIQAFAFLVVPKNIDLGNNAIRRLKSIEINNSLGVGYNISKNDLEIRGPGSILGYKQSGKGFSSCGLEMYSKIISNFVALQLNLPVEKNVDVDVFSLSGIPSEYILNEEDRLFYHRAISFCLTKKGLNDLVDEMVDKYGPLNEKTLNLVVENELRILCNKGPVVSLKHLKGNIVLSLKSIHSDRLLLIGRVFKSKNITFYQKNSGFILMTLLNINMNKYEDVKCLKSFINYINEFK